MNKRGFAFTVTTILIIIVVVVILVLVSIIGFNITEQVGERENICLPILSDLGFVDSRYNCYVQTEDIAVTSFAVKFEEALQGFQVVLTNEQGEPVTLEIRQATQLESVRQITKNYGEPLSLPVVGEQEVYVVQGFYLNVEIYPITEKDGEQLVCGLSDSRPLQGCDSEISGLLTLGLPDEEVECNDGIDNDNDGFIDLQDFGCSSSIDNSEINNGNTECSDGIDNDNDGFIDQEDTQCVSPDDNSEGTTGNGGSGNGGNGGPGPNLPPSANFTAIPNTGPWPLSVTFNSSGSFDPDGTIVSYDWEFGDGENGTGEVIDHTYITVGNYTPFLTVTDDDGASHTVNKVNITVNDSVPTVNITSPLNGSIITSEDVDVSFDVAGWIVLGIDEDHIHFYLDNDPIAYMFYNGNNNTVEYNFASIIIQ